MNKSKYKLALADGGSEKSIQAVVPAASAVVKTREYCDVSEPLAQMIMREFDKGNAVSFAKTAKFPLKDQDLIIKEATELDRRKKDEVSKYMTQISELFIHINFMSMYRFIMLNNKFASVGAFIHEGNREEAYLKIINSGEDAMIDDLEEFLESQDRLAEIYKSYSKFNKAINDIMSANSDNELDQILNQLPNA